MGFPADETFYSNPTRTSPKEDTMTDKIQSITEAGFPLQLHYIDGANCPFTLTAAGISIVGFNDRDLAARTLQDAHELRIQTDHNGTSVLQDGDEIGSSTYTPFVAIEEALQNLATSGRQWDYQAITLTPEDIDGNESDDPAVGDICTGAHDDLFVTTANGQWQLTISEALSLTQGLTTMVNHVLNNPWSNEDRSTILSRGTEKAV